MPSKALLNVITSLAFVEGAIMMLKDANRNEPDSELHPQIDELIVLIRKAHTLWPGKVDRKYLKTVDKKMKQWESELFPDKRVDFIILSSMGMAMIEEILFFVREDNKISCLIEIIEGLKVIHHHFDPNLEENTLLYETADRAFNLWKEINNK